MRQLKIPGIMMLMLTLLFCGTALSGDITGTVTDLAGGQPIVGLDMNIYDSDWSFLTDSTVTSAGGFYRFSDLAPGNYYVRANPKYPFHYQHQYWPNAAHRDNAITVTVPETGEITGIDFSLTEGWYIIGKVSELLSGAVLNGVGIRVYDAEWARMDVLSETDQYGRYYIGGLPGGQYYVMADPSYPEPHLDQYFDHSAGPINAVTVTLSPPDDLLGISFDLESGTYILGQLTDKDTGSPLSGVIVRAYTASGSVMRINDRSDDDGRYILGAYREGEYYVRADPSYPRGYMDQFYPDAFTMEDAQRISIALPKPVFDVNLALSAGSYMRGNIFGNTGAPISDIKVKFFDRNWKYMELSTTFTKEDGSFLSGALKPGMYYVKAVPIYPQPWIDIFYPDTIDKEEAEQIPMALAGETTGIDLALQPGGYLTGTITHGISGNPLEDIDMDVYDAEWNWVNYGADTRRNGEFVIGALPFGSYYLQADPSLIQGFVPLFYQNAFMPVDAVLIGITGDKNADHLDFSMSDGGFIAGTVTDAVSGLPLEDIKITVLTMEEIPLPIHVVKTDTSGSFTAYGIPGGSYLVAASLDPGDDYQHQYYNDSVSVAGASAVAVSPPDTTTEIDFHLTIDPKPTATPAVTLGVMLEIPSDTFRYKDLFYLNARVCNPGQSMSGIPLFVILDIVGEMFFWPSWRSSGAGIDYQLIDLDSGVRILPVLPVFEWPKIKGTMTDLHFYGGMTRPDFSRLLGDLDIATFGYTDQ